MDNTTFEIISKIIEGKDCIANQGYCLADKVLANIVLLCLLN
jgi:hypothetical protein